MQIEILNGGEILYNCRIKFNQNLKFQFVWRDTEQFKFNLNLTAAIRIRDARYRGI